MKEATSVSGQPRACTHRCFTGACWMGPWAGDAWFPHGVCGEGEAHVAGSAGGEALAAAGCGCGCDLSAPVE